MGMDEVDAAFAASPLLLELQEIFEQENLGRLDSDAKRQHFVPQLLLRGFSQPRDGKDTLYQLDVRRGQAVRTDPRAAASRRNLYSVFEPDGSRHNRFEGFLALVESHASPLFTKLLDEPSSLSDPERATLSFFLAIQTQRTPAQASRIRTFANTAMRSIMGAELSNRETFAAKYKKFFDEPDASDEQIDAFREDVIGDLREGRVQLHDPGGAAFSLGLGNAAGQSVIIFQLTWTLMWRRDAFVASDRAFAQHDPSPMYPWSSEGLISSPEAQTFVPLSGDACLRLSIGTSKVAVEEATARDTEAVNLKIYGWADHYIFGRTQEIVTSVRRAAKGRPSEVARPRKQHQVMLLDVDPEDDSFANENRRRGWPARLSYRGVEHDYVAIPVGEPEPELLRRIDEAVERRARKLLGVGDDVPLPGGARINALHPAEVDDV